MPRKNKVPTLEELALCSIGEYVTKFGKSIVNKICNNKINNNNNNDILDKQLNLMKIRLSTNVPWNIYNDMAKKVLNSIMNLINKTKNSYNDYEPICLFLSEFNVYVNLIDVVIHNNLRTIEFSKWPKIMRHMLYNNLINMSGLEILDLGSGSDGWRTSDIEKLIINGIKNMNNLISFTLCFDCTDNIITAVCNNCKKLQIIDVTASRSVTDRSVNELLKCRYLRDIKLFRTSLTINGYSKLLKNLYYLENIGRCDDIGKILENINKNNINNNKINLNIKTFESRNITIEHLFYVIDICPYITCLSMMCNEKIQDLRILSTLKNLVELKLLSCDYYGDYVNELLELTNQRLLKLHFEHVDEIDKSALIYISQYCPNIKTLIFYNCDFLDNITTNFHKLIITPFKYLEYIKCIADCASDHLEFLLSHCINIKFIQLGSSTGIGDLTMKNVFNNNCMTKLEEIKILYSSDLSMKTVKLLMKNCENLRRLSELESWHGISPSELDIFRNDLRINNVDLDTSPTLSFA